MKTTRNDNFMKINADHVINALEDWLRTLKVLKPTEVIESIPSLKVDYDGTIQIQKGREPRG